jgi:Uma2 family endonuclease
MAETERYFRELLKNFNRIENHFSHIPDVYVLGDMMMYYEESDPRKSISPDIFVAFGIGKKERRIYKIWEEGKPPDFVLEFASKGTYRNDLTGKVQLYAEIGIPEYFLYDVDRRYLPTPLMGFRLSGHAYVEIPALPNGGIPSKRLGLEFHLLDDDFGIYDPEAEEWLNTAAEAAQMRAEAAEDRAEDAEERANQETTARQKAEAEVARLQEELERLRVRR